MARTRPLFNYRVFTTFLMVGLPVIIVAAVLVLGVGQARLRASYERHLASVAEHTAASIDAYVFRLVIDATVVGRVPDVRTAAAGSRAALDMARVNQLDQDWQRGAATDVKKSLLDNTASRFLADVARQNPIYRELLLTDLQGRLVAASNVTSDYFQADEDWWRTAFGDGVSGRAHVGDVQWDESAGIFALDIALPVAEPGSERLAGILKIAADVREIGAVVGGVRLGETGDAVLVRPDGSIVFQARQGAAEARYFAAALLAEQTSLASGDPQSRVTVSARDPGGAQRLVAVAPSQLGASYPNLTWLVAVSQQEAELLEPIRGQAWNLVLAIAVIAVVVLALALWFSMRLSAPPIDADVDMHLVEHPRRIEREETT
jgi:hypothetical protein